MSEAAFNVFTIDKSINYVLINRLISHAIFKMSKNNDKRLLQVTRARTTNRKHIHFKWYKIREQQGSRAKIYQNKLLM